jgi:hypothetical protein
MSLFAALEAQEQAWIKEVEQTYRELELDL